MKKRVKNTNKLKRRRKKRKRNSNIIIGLILIIILFLGIFKFTSTINKPLKISNEEVVLVEEGDSFYSIVSKLKSENKIKSPLIIKIYAKLTGLNLEVVPGSHT